MFLHTNKFFNPSKVTTAKNYNIPLLSQYSTRPFLLYQAVAITQKAIIS